MGGRAVQDTENPRAQPGMAVPQESDQLDAIAGGVGPFELDGVGAELFGFPGADVADFAVVVVVPALAGDGISDGFAKFVRACGRERWQDREPAHAAGAAGIRHGGVKDPFGSDVVIAAKNFAAGAAALLHRGAGRKKDKVERVGVGGRKGSVREFRFDQGLNRRILDGFAGLGRSENFCADALAVADGFSGDAVFAELVEKRAGEDEIEEGVHLLAEQRVGGIMPCCAPEEGEDLDVGEKRAVAIGEVGRGGGGIANVGMKRNDPDGRFRLRFYGRMTGLAGGTRGHGWLLAGRLHQAG